MHFFFLSRISQKDPVMKLLIAYRAGVLTFFIIIFFFFFCIYIFFYFSCRVMYPFVLEGMPQQEETRRWFLAVSLDPIWCEMRSLHASFCPQARVLSTAKRKWMGVFHLLLATRLHRHRFVSKTAESPTCPKRRPALTSSWPCGSLPAVACLDSFQSASSYTAPSALVTLLVVSSS